MTLGQKLMGVLVRLQGLFFFFPDELAWRGPGQKAGDKFSSGEGER